MNDLEKAVFNANLIEDFLREKYPDSEVDPGKDISKSWFFYILDASSDNRMILRVTYLCFADNNIDSIKRKIESHCMKAMENNRNKEVVLGKDLEIEINEL